MDLNIEDVNERLKEVKPHPTDLQTLVLLGVADVSQLDLGLEVDVVLVVGVRGRPPPGGAPPPSPAASPPPADRRRRGPPRRRDRRRRHVSKIALRYLNVTDSDSPSSASGFLVVFRSRGLRPADEPVLAPGPVQRRHVGVAVAAPGRVHPAGALRPHVRPQPRGPVP